MAAVGPKVCEFGQLMEGGAFGLVDFQAVEDQFLDLCGQVGLELGPADGN